MIACHVGELLKGEVMGSRRTNNLIMEFVRTHKGGFGVDALQGCEPEVYGPVGSTGRVVTIPTFGKMKDFY